MNHYEEYYNYYLITIIISNIAVIITVIIITERLGGISLKAGYIYLFDLQFDQDALFCLFLCHFSLNVGFFGSVE